MPQPKRRSAQQIAAQSFLAVVSTPSTRLAYGEELLTLLSPDNYCVNASSLRKAFRDSMRIEDLGLMWRTGCHRKVPAKVYIPDRVEVTRPIGISRLP